MTLKPLPSAVGTERSTVTIDRQIRGSSLLLAGRINSLAVKLVAQVIVVRYLSMADYGTWAYSLSIVAMLGGFAHLSLDRAVTRFVSIYHQQAQYPRFFGTIVLVTAMVLTTGLLFVGGVYLFDEQVARLLGKQEHTLALLFIMIFLVPLEALDALFIAIIASFGSARSIFLRRYVLAPAVHLSVVVLLVMLHADITFLAVGYVFGALLGAATSAWLLVRILREQGLLRELRTHGLHVPARELFVFSLPLMTSDWLAVMMESSGTLVLGYLYDAEYVALFRTVFPLAVLNQVVIQSFGTLYEPAVSRSFAKQDGRSIRDLYWQTTLWITVLSFPIFAFTFAAATPLTVLFYGERYEAAGMILTVLALGQYIQAVSGFNGKTIKAVGEVRSLVVINLVTLVVNLVVTVLLVPPLGAMGVAVSLTITFIVHNALKQVGLYRATGIALPSRQLARPFVGVGVGITALSLLLFSGVRSPAVLFLAAVVISLFVLADARRTLRIMEVFPELGRIRFLSLLLT